jgi:uncharacterized protein YndB with AHSA1/START domain
MVWDSLTQSKEISAWLMKTEDFKPEVGHRFLLQAPPMPGWDGKIYGEVLKADAPHSLWYIWKGSLMKSETVVKWTLTPEGNGTRLTLEHSGFSGIAGSVLALFHGPGWSRFMKQLSMLVKKT